MAVIGTNVVVDYIESVDSERLLQLQLQYRCTWLRIIMRIVSFFNFFPKISSYKTHQDIVWEFN